MIPVENGLEILGVRRGRGGGEVTEGGLFQVIKKKLLKEVLAESHYSPELTPLFPAAEPSMAARGGGGGMGYGGRGG